MGVLSLLHSLPEPLVTSWSVDGPPGGASKVGGWSKTFVRRGLPPPPKPLRLFPNSLDVTSLDPQ